jgi:malate dehydrogenase (oxaloacetate-decarboxylating)
MRQTPSPSYGITIRLEINNRVGMLGRVTTAIGQAGGDIRGVDIAGFGKGTIIRDISVYARDEEHCREIIETLKRVRGIKIINVSDRTFLVHLGGKIEVHTRTPVKTRDDLAMVYTPGVARVCNAIYEDVNKVFRLTIKSDMVAVVTDGTAVLGLGDIGPEAALPVMEGKAMLFKEFGNVNAFPICLATKDPDEIVKTVKYISPVFGGINLEDISAPRCFYIEEKLKEEIDIPVFHDDQHGTAVVVLAALINALKIVKKEMKQIRVVISGMGAAGVAVTKLLLSQKVGDVIGCDRTGAIFRGRAENMNPAKEWIAQNTNKGNLKGTLKDALKDADVFIGLSAPGLLKGSDLKKMKKDAIVFAMANPTPEVMPEEMPKNVRIIATGRSDYPNQINNVLCFPGLFRGVLDVRAREINERMKISAAKAIAEVVSKEELHEDYIIPSVFNKKVALNVAREVRKTAYATGVARRERKTFSFYF